VRGSRFIVHASQIIGATLPVECLYSLDKGDAQNVRLVKVFVAAFTFLGRGDAYLNQSGVI
jgi:hypothetical protein